MAAGTAAEAPISRTTEAVSTLWMHDWADHAESIAVLDTIIRQPQVHTLVLDMRGKDDLGVVAKLFPVLHLLDTLVLALPADVHNFPTLLTVPPAAVEMVVQVMTPTLGFPLQLLPQGPGSSVRPVPPLHGMFSYGRPGNGEPILHEYIAAFPRVERVVFFDSPAVLTVEASVSTCTDDGTDVVVADADRLLMPIEYHVELGRAIVAACPRMQHLIVCVDDMGRDLSKLAALLGGVGRALMSVVIQFNNAERYHLHDLDPLKWDMQVVVDMGPFTDCTPQLAGWSCEDDVQTCTLLFSVAFQSTGGGEGWGAYTSLEDTLCARRSKLEA
jgi:hypothetical protein